MLKSLFDRGNKGKADDKLSVALRLQDKNFFWNPKDRIPNIGDYLAFETVNYLLNLKDKHPIEIREGKILSIGSVLHFAQDNDVVWGTGRNGKISEDKHKFSKLDVRAVRGPNTKKYLEEKGIRVPDIFGDPGILASLIYPKHLLEQVFECPKSDFVIVPQLNDNIEKYKGYEKNLVSPRQLPAHFISKIINAELVVASSLHGLILAESYGIPAVFFNSGSGETMFKYEDYYYGTGRESFIVEKKLASCFNKSTSPIPDISRRQKVLVKNFPFDRY